ncbi:hypothetical protein BACPLE_01907 [Phocaeicola plebeius DSM 17135]|uniref:Uncharacterized protein n=1 Tax=Phocaeicola plebeius (strain DSM 17135 / JCM 12973 / CCUG 54634 / M2) TaxID=484018 RepID=B5CYV0_PHOPM|nr:hypothetical protein BACPLE_01907 [Phocaeicola plebeius DSM 17135]
MFVLYKFRNILIIKYVDSVTDVTCRTFVRQTSFIEAINLIFT